jgi:hypothetical protein
VEPYRARLVLLVYDHGIFQDPRIEKRWLDLPACSSLENAYGQAAKAVRAATQELAREENRPIEVHVAWCALLKNPGSAAPVGEPFDPDPQAPREERT